MKVVGCLQARISSSRLPGKVMALVDGRPMIARQIERLDRISGLDELVVATSNDPTDDLLADFVESIGVSVHRGSLNDVLQRYVEVIDIYRPDVMVRFTADCPLVSPLVADELIREFLSLDVDYLSNTLTPTYPDGLDVEVFRPEALEWVYLNSSDPNEREHVTLGIYRRPDQFKVANYSGKSNHSNLRWTVDTSDDLEFVREVYKRLQPKNPAFEYHDVLDLLTEFPDLNRTSKDSARNAALEGLDTGAMNA